LDAGDKDNKAALGQGQSAQDLPLKRVLR
jgi:hypothetical protein